MKAKNKVSMKDSKNNKVEILQYDKELWVIVEDESGKLISSIIMIDEKVVKDLKKFFEGI